MDTRTVVLVVLIVVAAILLIVGTACFMMWGRMMGRPMMRAGMQDGMMDQQTMSPEGEPDWMMSMRPIGGMIGSALP